MSSAIVHSYYFAEAGLLAFIEFHSLYNLLIEVIVQVPGVVVILCSMYHVMNTLIILEVKFYSAVLCEGLSWSWSRDQSVKVLVLARETVKVSNLVSSF